jgi:uncharacterized protein
MSIQLKKALLVFAKCPQPGQVKTRLAPPLLPGEAAELYRRMLCDVMAKVTLLPEVERYLFYEEGKDAREYFSERAHGMTCFPQQGKDLGERMADAFRTVFAMGHHAVIVIGTDSPDLPFSFINNAFGMLEYGESGAVFGPSEDGGYYLVGMTQLYRELFHDIPWSSERVLQESLKRAEEAGISVSLLPVWHDVDNAVDLERAELLDEGNGAPLTREFIGKWLKRGND